VTAAAEGSRLVLLVLASAQFLMTLDSSVMNVSIASVAADLNTTVTGIQTAITLYTLVMATLMIPGGKIGAMIGRRRAFGIGCVIYACGSFTTALAPNLTVLLIGWSLLEGIGAALIMPATVALVAANFGVERRSTVYGLIAAAGAMAVAAGPLIGGAVTTYASWRWVFAGEVVIVIGILSMLRRIHDVPPTGRTRLDVVGMLLSMAGLGLAILGVLRSSEWGWLVPKEGQPTLFGLSLTIWFVLFGVALLYLLLVWDRRRERIGKEPLIRTSMFRNRQLTGGLTMFFFQFAVQAGAFFTVPLFLSVVLGLSAVATGVRLLPLSVALLLSAGGVPKIWPTAPPRRVVRIGLLLLFVGTVILIAGIDEDATAAVVFAPLLLMGLGIGALASQLGAVTVSAVPDELAAEVGGLQNTATNVGASLGTALVGSVLIAILSTAFLENVLASPSVSDQVKSQAQVKLESGVPFISDADLQTALGQANVSSQEAAAVEDAYASARLVGLRSALAFVALFALIALFFSGRIPWEPLGPRAPPEEAAVREPNTATSGGVGTA
jgi:EmrB/QacA subfamily drug resistance transporter